MADTGIFCTTAEVQRKVGANASATSNVEAYINDFVTQAESFINAISRHNWSDVYTTLNADVKGILKEAASDLAAIYVLNYDFNSANVSRIEIEDRINVLYTRFIQCIALLEAQKTIDYVAGA